VLCAYTSWGYFASPEENQLQLNEFARVLKPGGVLLLDLVGRNFLEKAIGLAPGGWYEVEEGGIRYRERVRWVPGKRRVLTDRAFHGTRFRHDIWIPTDGEIRGALREAGLILDQTWGGLGNQPWDPFAERWIYRSIKR
jgi:SAM-dependent methyltransferase